VLQYYVIIPQYSLYAILFSCATVRLMVRAQSSRSSYHSDLKIAFQLGLVPTEISQKVPRSTKHRFRNADYSSLVGTEFSAFLEKLDLVKNIMSSRSTLAVACAFLRIVSLLRALNLSIGALPKIRKTVVGAPHFFSESLFRDIFLPYHYRYYG